MKKEFSTLIQFILITGLVAVYYYLVLPVKYPELSIEAMEYAISDIRYWIYSFIGLGAVRFGIVCIISRKAFVDTNESQLKFFLNELSKTFQYFIIAVFSTFGVFWLFLFNFHNDHDGFSIDLISVWFGILYESKTWLTAFSVLSLLRLGIVLIWNRLAHNKKSAAL